MLTKRILIRIIVWSFVAICIVATIFLNYFGNINHLKKLVEKNLKDQLTCSVLLGDLDWDLDGIRLGVSTTTISLFDQENNLVLQAGPTRFVWDLKNIIWGKYAHFYSIDSTDLYVNPIRNKNNKWNLIEMFPPGPAPEIDYLKLHNSILYLVDDLNPKGRESLFTDLNVSWGIIPHTHKRTLDLTTKIGSLTVSSSLKIKGRYLERKGFNWQKDEFKYIIVAKRVDLSKLYGYFVNFSKDPKIKSLQGEFSGSLFLHKRKNIGFINLRSRTSTKNFSIGLQSKDNSQVIEIPKTDFILRSKISENKIQLNKFKSRIDDLRYELQGSILNWSKEFPESDLSFKTNKFNFKKIKPFLPLSLLPPSTRMRIEPINDDGFITINLRLKGNQLSPKYVGTILLDDFNLTKESGFLSSIQGLNGKLNLDNELLKIEYLNIPIENIPLTIKGYIDSTKVITSFNLYGKGLNTTILKNIIIESGIQPPILNNIFPEGNIDLNLDIFITNNSTPEIKGNIGFNNIGAILITENPIEVKNIFGSLILDGTKVIIDKVHGFINKEPFFIRGNFSLKEDENLDLLIDAKHLTILGNIVGILTEKTPFTTIGKTFRGEANNLSLKIAGTLSKPVLDGMVLINNVSFALPNLKDKIHNVNGSLRFKGLDLIIESIAGTIQNSHFEITGLLNNLFTLPEPRLHLVTEDLEISNFWKFAKGQLEKSSFKAQADAVKKLNGIAALNLTINPTSITGSIDLKNGLVSHDLIPFDINMIVGMVLLDKSNVNITDLMGGIGEKSNFLGNITIFNYLNPDFKIEGMLQTDLDPQELSQSFNNNIMADLKNLIISDGVIPTQINFNTDLPIININLVSILSESLMLELPGFLKKPIDKSYVIAGDVSYDSKKQNIVLNDISIKSNKLLVSTMGSLNNLDTKDPSVMLYFTSKEPCGLFMIIEPIVPLMGFKMWGMIEFNGSVTGTTSMYEVTSFSMLTELEIPNIMTKSLTASDGSVSTIFDGKTGVLNADINNVMISNLNATSLSVSANYIDPVININKLVLDSNQGNITGNGYYDPRDGNFDFNADGESIDLGGLASLAVDKTSNLAGKTDFTFMLAGYGMTNEEIIKHTKGTGNFTIVEGKIGQIALLHKVLQFSNIFTSGIFGFNLTNIFSLFFKYQDGSFNKIQGNFNINDGTLEAKEFAYRGKDLLLNVFGSIDLNKSLLDLKFYGFLPVTSIKSAPQDKKNISVAKKVAETVSSAITIIPDSFGKSRFYIPFLSAHNSRYFKFELVGNTKEQKKLVAKARRSFKWLNKKTQIKENQFLPQP